VELVEYYGHDTVYLVSAGGQTSVRVRTGSAPVLQRGAAAALRYAGRPTVAFAVAEPDATPVAAGR
jgi:hypothetical protein